MLLTALEIVAFIVAAAIIGVALGWVLRGTLGREQEEISDLRSQLRQLKKANRENKAALAETASRATAEPVVSEAVDKPAEEKAKAKKASAKKAPEKKASAKKVTAKPGTKTATKNKVATKTAKKSPIRKTQAEREADQAVGRKAFAEVTERIGEVDADDNLTKIHGIGKKYATMLNDLGITSYKQVSLLRKADVRTLAVALGVLDDRLETEDWVGSAKTLMKQAKK